MGKFDFLKSTGRYSVKNNDLIRLEQRHAFLIEPFKEFLDDANVLDIAAHDGRWSYALAAAGAKSVQGIEGRQELVSLFDKIPNNRIKGRVTLETCDLYEKLDQLTNTNKEFDVIALFGIMYHVMDHFGILRKCLKLKPKIIIIDSEFIRGKDPVIRLVREDTRKSLNALPQIEDQTKAIIGIPSVSAMTNMAAALNCDIVWMPWEDLPEKQRIGVSDYFRDPSHARIRKTCALLPWGDD